MRHLIKCAVLATGLSVCAVQAEVLSLTTANAVDFEEGGLFIDAGASLGDINFFGGRVAYAASDSLLIFGDAGLAEWDDVSDQDGPSFGGGLIFAFDVDLPFSIGARGSYHLFSSDDADTTDIAVGLVAGGEIGDSDNLKWFANLALHMLEVEIDLGPLGSGEADDDEVGIGGGVIYEHSDTLSYFVGIDNVDETFLSGGIRLLMD